MGSRSQKMGFLSFSEGLDLKVEVGGLVAWAQGALLTLEAFGG